MLLSIKRRVALASISIGICIGLAGCYLFPKEQEVLAPPAIEPGKAIYNTLKVQREDNIKEAKCYGSFISTSTVGVFYSDVSGTLKKISANMRDPVKKGQVVAELYTDNVEEQIKQKQIQVNKIKEKYAINNEQTQSSIELQKLELNQLYSDRKKMQSLESIYTKSDVEQINSKISVAEKKLEILEKSIKSNGRMEALEVEEVELQLQALNKTLEQSKLRAPIDGNVVYINKLDPGDKVSPGQIIMKIADPNQLQLECGEGIITLFKLGDKVKVEIDSEIFDGVVSMTPEEIPENTEITNKNIIRVDVEGAKGKASLGKRAAVRLVLEKKEKSIMLPKSLVKTTGGNSYVQVLEDNVPKERLVELGEEMDSKVEIVKGLKEGDQVIVR